MSAILTFLGGSAFRAVWGEFSSWLNARQEHAHEMDRMRLQAQLDAAVHDRNIAGLRVQSELGLKNIQVQSEANLAQLDATMLSDAIKIASTPTGIHWVDAWSALIRPAYASVCLLLWCLCLHRQEFKLTEWDYSLLGSVAGFFFADRMLRRNGK